MRTGVERSMKKVLKSIKFWIFVYLFTLADWMVYQYEFISVIYHNL